MLPDTPTPVFELIDPLSSETEMDVCGLWESHSGPQPAAVAISYSTAARGPEREAFNWRTNLPEDLSLAANHLGEGEARLENYLQSLDKAAVEIGKLVEAGSRTGEVVSFSPTTASIERELLRLLRAESVSGSIAFGLPNELSNRLSEISPQFAMFLTRLQRLISHYAKVETLVGGVLIARTLVTWVGDNHTLWRKGISKREIILHQRTLDLSLRSRDAWLKTFIVIAQGTLKLSLLLGSGAVVLALPAAWRMVQGTLEQVDMLSRISSEMSKLEETSNG
jgi:hypothetical protein